jgi:hypothetical protein
MYRFPSGGAKTYIAALVLLALVATWLGFRGSSPQLARDFEECVEQIQAKAPSTDGRGALMTDCNARFAGRRKAVGGYTYYDFMQNRSFDIAGPNPTAEERKQIDREYMSFLDAQRREAVSAELARKQNERLQAEFERKQNFKVLRTSSRIAGLFPGVRFVSSYCSVKNAFELLCAFREIVRCKTHLNCLNE